MKKPISKTPRTDRQHILNYGPNLYVKIGFARQLERQLNAANERIKRLEEELNDNGLVLQKIQHERDVSNDRIKRLEAAGDELLRDNDDMANIRGWWRAKEANP